MQKHSFSPKIPSEKIIYNPYSLVLVKTAPQSNVVCRCLPKSSDTGVVANTKGEEMMTSLVVVPPLLLLVLAAQPLACTRLWYHEKIGGRELELLQTPTPIDDNKSSKKKWRRSVARALVEVNVERSLSAPVDVERSLMHIMNVSSSWAWHLNRWYLEGIKLGCLGDA